MIEVCRCGHARRQHLYVNLGGDGPEPGRCAVCPCRQFRLDAVATAEINAPSFVRTGEASYAVWLGDEHVGDVVKHRAGYGVKVLWNAYLPGESDASFEWATTRRAAAEQLANHRVAGS